MTMWIAELLSLSGSARGGLGPEASDVDRTFTTAMTVMGALALALAALILWAL